MSPVLSLFRNQLNRIALLNPTAIRLAHRISYQLLNLQRVGFDDISMNCKELILVLSETILDHVHRVDIPSAVRGLVFSNTMQDATNDHKDVVDIRLTSGAEGLVRCQDHPPICGIRQ